MYLSLLGLEGVLNIYMLHSKEIKSKLNDYDEFIEWFGDSSFSNNRTVDQLARWELREALSYYYAIMDNTSNIDSIVNSISQGHSTDWSATALSLVDEARIQTKLRQLGYEITCIDQWPTTTDAFKQILTQVEIPKPITPSILSQVTDKLASLIFFRYNYALVSIALIFYYQDWLLLAISIWFAHLMWGLIEFADHDYFEHRYVVPKNRVLQHLIDYLCYIWMPFTYVDKSASMRIHMYHHKYWKTDRDTFDHKINSAILWFTNPPIFSKPIAKVKNRLLKEYADFPYVVKYLREIEIAISIIVVALVGFKYYFFFFLFPILLRGAFQGQHDMWFLILGERDHPWVFPIGLNQSWHLTHHRTGMNIQKTWGEVFNGPWWVKYLNPQYYFGRLFFKLKYQPKVVTYT